MLRMELPDRTTINIWDVAEPPDLLYFPICIYPRDARLLHTLDLHKVSGLSFLMLDFGVCAIHGHTSEQPSAISTIEALLIRDRAYICCLFVPLPPGEKILAIGVRLLNRTIPRFLVNSTKERA